MPWGPRINPLKLKKENDRLAFQLIRAREDLQIAERHRVGLEVMLSVSEERIDALTTQVDRLRQQNKKLGAECEHLAEMIRSAPPVDAAMLVPK
jgi:hypothetical protein